MHTCLYTDTGSAPSELLVCAAWAQVNSLTVWKDEILLQMSATVDYCPSEPWNGKTLSVPQRTELKIFVQKENL